MITNIAFDLGGVVLHLDFEQAIHRFESLGLKDARERMDLFHQKGIFGDIEEGKITEYVFRRELSTLVGHEVTIDECAWAWQGYAKEVPEKNLRCLEQLHSEGFKLCILSNTNPFMMRWALKDFDGQGHGLAHYFDHLYLSYRLKTMKPGAKIFERMLDGQQATAAETLFIDDSPKNCAAAEALGIRTLCPQNNEDWIEELWQVVHC